MLGAQRICVTLTGHVISPYVSLAASRMILECVVYSCLFNKPDTVYHHLPMSCHFGVTKAKTMASIISMACILVPTTRCKVGQHQRRTPWRTGEEPCVSILKWWWFGGPHRLETSIFNTDFDCINLEHCLARQVWPRTILAEIQKNVLECFGHHLRSLYFFRPWHNLRIPTHQCQRFGPEDVSKQNKPHEVPLEHEEFPCLNTGGSDCIILMVRLSDHFAFTMKLYHIYTYIYIYATMYD